MKNWQKLVVAGLVLVFLVIGGIIVWRLFFDFKNEPIQSYINQEAQKYTNPPAIALMINDGVQHILNDRNLTKQVKDYARTMGISKEQALVAAAIAEAKEHYPQIFK